MQLQRSVMWSTRTCRLHTHDQESHGNADAHMNARNVGCTCHGLANTGRTLTAPSRTLSYPRAPSRTLSRPRAPSRQRSHKSHPRYLALARHCAVAPTRRANARGYWRAATRRLARKPAQKPSESLCSTHPLPLPLNLSPMPPSHPPSPMHPSLPQSSILGFPIRPLLPLPPRPMPVLDWQHMGHAPFSLQ